MSRRVRSATALGGILLIAACTRPAPSAAPALTPVSLQADWFAEPEQAGNYQALARGFYRQAGLDVTLLNGGPACYPLAKVASGQADAALGRSDDIILAVANAHLPVVIVCAYMERDPMAVLVHAAGPVKDFPDLAGQAVMADAGSGWVPYLKARYRMDFALVPLNYSLSRFIADPTLIVQGFATNEPYFLRQQGVAFRTLLLANSGYDPYRVIYANRRFARGHPDAVRAFVAATLRGWEEVLQGKAAPGERLIRAINPAMTPDRMAFGFAAMQKDQLLRGNPARGERLGLITRRRLQEQVDLFVRLKIIPAAVPLEDFVSFDYLPPALAALARN